MITELLDAAMKEAVINRYEITQVQLGKEPMRIFIEECKNAMGIPVKADIATVKNYKGISIAPHPTRNAVMYSLNRK